ncbi:hypothetical protein [Paraburkholderia youngii]|uniref:Uncharacterized protein n=1 Tax=Paraburkholderia youngii TaxID=2782701 RepID=A0A7Y6N0Z7_9BURK|nr:hypothetical protein [Paraburkholderia youngii]NUY01561.1 hypothetical protein [Paraburkholderia youngii]
MSINVVPFDFDFRTRPDPRRSASLAGAGAASLPTSPYRPWLARLDDILDPNVLAVLTANLFEKQFLFGLESAVFIEETLGPQRYRFFNPGYCLLLP